MNLSGTWNLHVSEKAESVHVPGDHRQFHKTGEITELNYERLLDESRLSTFSEPAILLGRIGDIDEAFLDDVKIGSTGAFFGR